MAKKMKLSFVGRIIRTQIVQENLKIRRRHFGISTKILMARLRQGRRFLSFQKNSISRSIKYTNGSGTHTRKSKKISK